MCDERQFEWLFPSGGMLLPVVSPVFPSLFISMFQTHKAFHLDESTGELCVLCHYLVLVVQCVFTATCSLVSVFLGLSQALASHRAYLLTARIPAKVRPASQSQSSLYCACKQKHYTFFFSIQTALTPKIETVKFSYVFRSPASKFEFVLCHSVEDFSRIIL